MARFAPSFLTTAAALGLMAGAALAQDFNAAPPNAPDQEPAFEGQTRAPIITQDVLPVSHAYDAEAMRQAGRDVEKVVLARALKLDPGCAR